MKDRLKTYYVNVSVRSFRGGRLKVVASSPEEAVDLALDRAWGIWEGRGCVIEVRNVKETSEE